MLNTDCMVAKNPLLLITFLTNVNTYYWSFRKLTITSSCSAILSKSPFCWPTQNYEFWGYFNFRFVCFLRNILACGLCSLNFKLLSQIFFKRKSSASAGASRLSCVEIQVKGISESDPGILNCSSYHMSCRDTYKNFPLVAAHAHKHLMLVPKNIATNSVLI